MTVPTTFIGHDSEKTQSNSFGGRMLRCRRFLLVGVGLITCLLFLQLGLENWNYNGLTYRFVDKSVEKNLQPALPLATEKISTDTNYSNLNGSESEEVSSTDRKGGLTTKSPDTKDWTLIVSSTSTPSIPIRLTKNDTNSIKDISTNATITRVYKFSQSENAGSTIRTGRQLVNIDKNTPVVRKIIGKIKIKPVPVLTPEQTLKILGNVIGSLPVVPSEKVIRVLVATYFRSGSTFLGDVLQQNWKTFYHFEPLHYMSDGLRVKANQTEEALSLLEDIFRCNFSTNFAAKYLQWGEEQRHQFLFKRNRFLWVACRMQPKNCFRPDFARFICERAPIQVMKVNRLHLRDVKRLVEDNPELDIRVVNLVRDPRGTISSRKVLEWCNTTSCSDFRVLCSEMSNDYDAFQKLATLKPNRFFQLRYEDLSVYPETVSRNMFSALGLPFSTSVSRFLKTNTRARPLDKKDPYSTRRDSSKTPFEWRRKINFNEIKKLQIGCRNVISNYRYEFLNSTKDLKSHIPVLSLGDRPWWIKP